MFLISSTFDWFAAPCSLSFDATCTLLIYSRIFMLLSSPLPPGPHMRAIPSFPDCPDCHITTTLPTETAPHLTAAVTDHKPFFILHVGNLIFLRYIGNIILKLDLFLF